MGKIGRGLKSVLTSLGAGISVIFAEYLGIPEEAGRTFFDTIIGMADTGTAFAVIIGAVLTFLVTWFFPTIKSKVKGE